jgi:fumarylacetoacetase
MTWFDPPPEAPFGLTELPYGVYATADRAPRVGVAIGDHVLDVAALWRRLGRDPAAFERPSLNPFLAQGPAVWTETRAVLQAAVADGSGRELLAPHLTPISEARLHLPIEVADYVDFYASIHHAGNVGRIFRPGGDPLTPNWRHMPIGYHGRSGTVVVSGTDVIRPQGQVKAADEPMPGFGPTRKLDIEAELGWVVGVGSTPGVPLPVDAFAEHVFGVVILNDWSARDIQAWEYVPLGPFLGKSFATSISAWVLPLQALEEAVVVVPDRPELLPYLRGPSHGYAIDVEIELNGQVVSRCPYASMHYSPAQMLAHMTINGAHVRTGDLYGSGTISGPEPDQRGSLLELSWNGTTPLRLADGSTRTFLEDGDVVVMHAVGRGRAPARLGEVRGTIVPGDAP